MTNATGLLSGILTALAFLYPSAALSGQEVAFPEFRAHLVAKLPGGYKVAAVDINRDGRPDVVGLATNPSCLAWYENPAWTKHVLTSRVRAFIDVAPHDIDADGRTDLAIAHEFGMSRTDSGGLLHWLRCPADPAAEWPLHAIGAEPTSHRIQWADIDGDGAKELINAPVMGRGAKAPLWDAGVRLLSYAVPDPPARESWTSLTIDDRLTVVHGVSIVNWDDDGRDDILTASFEGIHLFQPRPTGNTISWRKTRLGSGEQVKPTKRGSSEIALGRLTGGCRFLAAVEPWHGDKVVVYTPGPHSEAPWQRLIIDATFNEGHALICADLDANGADEIIAGYRGAGRSLYIYGCLDSSGRQWQRIPLDEGDMAASGLDVADVNGDGRLDVIAVGTATSNIKWYENMGSSR
ncbi:MAG: VCBS repeat-containing protein [Sedimentisphaerales bacterium]|nr:VCBS repeat-containing protein [Sedimentisphaerales bacterium]